MAESSPKPSSGPWPLAVGLLAASATTMIGILNGCEPETILYRCLVSGGVVTIIASLLRGLWHLVDSGDTT